MKKIFLFLLICFSINLKAQLLDNFSDGDFLFNPTWNGDTAGFNVNLKQQLQTKASLLTQSVYLSTSSNSAVNSVWTFDIQMNFDPSSTNQMRIYLVSNAADLKSTLNGYFFQIGETGNTDSYDLFKQTGTTATKIIDGAAHTRTFTDTVKTSIRVSRDIAGFWTLESDDAKSGSYQLEGNSTDNTYTNSSFIGVRAIYTATRSDKFFFDNFSISTLAVDNTPPTLISAATIDGINVKLTFSEALESTTALNPTNYSITGVGNPIAATFSGANNSIIDLELAQILPDGNYMVTVNNVNDLSGNPIGINNNQTFSFTNIPLPSGDGIVINELYADPSPSFGLPATEFAELLNTSNQPINLNGFKYADATSTYTFGNLILNAGEYLILSTRADTASYQIYGRVLGLTTFPSLNNAGDSISLKDASGKLLDQVNYSTSWYRSTTKANGGYTLERVDPFSACKNYINWNASNALIGGTPGTINSVIKVNQDTVQLKVDTVIVKSDDELQIVFNKIPDSATVAILGNYSVFNLLRQNQSLLDVSADFEKITLNLLTPLPAGTYILKLESISDCAGTEIDSAISYRFIISNVPIPGFPVIINEIFADPSPIIGLPEKEFIELYNTSNNNVSLAGLEYSDPTSTYIFTKGNIPANGFLILCPIADTALYAGFGNVIGISPFPSLNNTGDVLTLTDQNGSVVNQVLYSDSWYRDAIKKGGGYSLEKIDPLSYCNQAENWNASNDIIGGTPGKVNSVFALNADTVKLRILSVQVLSATEFQFNFSKNPDTIAAKNILNYELRNQAGTFISINAIAFDNGIFIGNLSQNLVPDTYFLKAKNINDCAGNLIDSTEFKFILTSVPTGEITLLINEIFPDPIPIIGLPSTEFIELYNPGSSAVSLKGITFSDPGTTTTFTGGFIDAGGYAVICDISDVSLFAAYPNVIGLSSFPSLNNSVDFIILKDKLDRVIDQVGYTDDWYRSSLKSEGGYTLERIDELSTCSGSNNWIASENSAGGTPGVVNSVNAKGSDTTTLRVINTQITGDSSVRLVFSKSVDLINLTSISSFQVNGSLTILATFPTPDIASVVLKFSDRISRGFNYQISFIDFKDCTGKPVSINPTSFLLALPVNKGDILINEILFNPKTGGSDFVEIYNNGENLIDLSELEIANADELDSIGTRKFISANQFFLAPKQFAVLSPDIENIKTSYRIESEQNFIQISSFPSFSDDEGRVVLLSGEKRLDQYNFSDDDHFSLLDNTEGVSLERISYSEKTQLKANWNSAASTNGFATPGFKNSQFQEIANANDDVNIDPKVFSPDNDGFEDELFINFKVTDPKQLANVTIFDMNGRQIRKLISNDLIAETGLYKWDGTNDDSEKVKVGVYIVYFELFNLEGEIKNFKKTCVLASKF